MSPSRLDAWTFWTLRAAGLLSGALVLLVLAFLALGAMPALEALGISRFVTDPGWHPGGGADAGAFNLLPMAAGTLFSTAGAVLLAAPLGIVSAIFCQFYAPPRLATCYRRILELLAGIPSVVYGFWGLTTLAPLIRRIEPPGTSLLAGVLVLAVMILPTVALLAEAALAHVPRSLLHSAAALGLSRWGTLAGVVLPAAKAGIGIAVLLATARALGETMAVLMVCGNVVKTPGSLFDPVRTLTANIAMELGYASGAHRAALFATGLLLTLLVVLLAGLAAWIQEARARA